MKDKSGTAISKTLMKMNPTCVPHLFAVSATECPEHDCKFDKHYLLVLPGGISPPLTVS